MAVVDTVVVDMAAAAVGIAADRDRAQEHMVVLLEEGTHTAVVGHPGKLVEGIPVVLAAGSTAGMACFAEEAYFLVVGTDSME